MSRSRQFVVYGPTFEIRGRYGEMAEEVKTELLALLDQRDSWKYPVILRLLEAPGGVAEGKLVRSSASQIGGTVRFSVTATLAPELTEEAVRRKLLEVLLFEHILRKSGAEGMAKAEKLRVPAWMIDGFTGATRYRSTGRHSRFFAQLYKSGRTLSIPEILKYDLDGKTSVQRLSFKASATGLVLALFSQPGGTAKFEKVLLDLFDFQSDDEAALLARFPELGASPESMAKWWTLELASLAEPGPLDIMNVVETESALQQALFVTIPVKEDPGVGAERKRWLKWLRRKDTKTIATNDEPPGLTASVPIEEVEALLRLTEEEREKFLGPNEDQLTELSVRAFPLYRPLIEEYQKGIRNLIEDESRDLARTFEALAKRRTILLKVSREVEDLLHWSEVNQTVRDPSRFSDLYRAHEELDAPMPKRSDRISKYLDSLEKEWAD